MPAAAAHITLPADGSRRFALLPHIHGSPVHTYLRLVWRNPRGVCRTPPAATPCSSPPCRTSDHHGSPPSTARTTCLWYSVAKLAFIPCVTRTARAWRICATCRFQQPFTADFCAAAYGARDVTRAHACVAVAPPLRAALLWHCDRRWTLTRAFHSSACL